MTPTPDCETNMDLLRVSLLTTFNKLVAVTNDLKQSPIKDDYRKLLSAMALDMAQLTAFENTEIAALGDVHFEVLEEK